MSATEMVDVSSEREGSRWIGGRPDGEEVADWFQKNVRIDEGLKHENYVSGLTLITGQEKIKVVREASNGARAIVEEERLVHTPYAKVETRVAYFWDLMALHDDWTGVIEPGPVLGGGVAGMPPGFFVIRTTRSDGKVANFICATMRVRILKTGTVREIEERKGNPRMGQQESSFRVEGEPVAVFPAATKMIAALKSNGNEDPFAAMKAETGAIGRALGMAGMLVIPGSGVATAEDMLEMQAGGPGADSAIAADLAAQDMSGEPELPARAAPAPAVDQRAEIVDMISRLESHNPAAMEEIREWAKGRRLNLNELSDTALRGVYRKLKAGLDGPAAATE